MVEEPDIEKDKADVRSIVDRYIAAITAGDEASAARFTCGKEDGGLLWIGAVGRTITALNVEVLVHPTTRDRRARVLIQVEGLPRSVLILKQIDGIWCVYP